MPFVVEDGTGLPNSNAYASVEDVSDHFTLKAMGAEWLSLTTVQKQASIIKATEFIDHVYRNRFLGKVATSEQALEWPRVNEQNPIASGVPQRVIQATAEYALRAAGGKELAPDLLPPVSGAIKAKTEKVGPLEETTQYSIPASGRLKPQYARVPSAEMYLSKLLKPSNGIQGRVYV